MEPLDRNKKFERELNVLDRMPAREIQKIGVIYVGPGQRTEQEVLGNETKYIYRSNLVNILHPSRQIQISVPYRVDKLPKISSSEANHRSLSQVGMRSLGCIK